MAVAPFMSQDPHPEGKRSTPRLHVPVGVSVNLTLAKNSSVFVNLRDVSDKGACVVRQGTLDLQEDDLVTVEILKDDSAAKISLSCKVCWVRDTGFNTYVGLSFVHSNLSQEDLARLIG
jgi:hypothetical protein